MSPSGDGLLLITTSEMAPRYHVSDREISGGRRSGRLPPVLGRDEQSTSPAEHTGPSHSFWPSVVANTVPSGTTTDASADSCSPDGSGWREVGLSATGPRDAVAEIRYGLRRLPAGKRRTVLRDAADDVFESFADHVLPFDADFARHYANIVVERERAGTPMSGLDAQVTGICRTHEAALATRNADDFTGLQLRLINPWAS